jgi:serine/threonine protein kinase/tetratricopeptide (TPR) repeat protein
MIGSKLGPYEITEEIGKGGMATVYRAYQPSMDRHVAVKVIRASTLGDTVGRDRFKREAKLIARLEHPHLLPVYDFNGEHDPPYIVMRFLEGGTLKQVMEAERLPADELIYLLQQVASALDYAHRQGVVHRDLKPSNIMIDKEGNAFIADFGIARVSDAPKDLTGTGNVIGTPGYMAPEQARGKVEVDGRADVYSLGVIVYELLAGRGPFERESPLDELMAHLQEPVPDIRKANPELSAELNQVLQRSLAKDREQRYATAEELVGELRQALKRQASSVPAQLRSLTQSFAAAQLAALEEPAPEAETPSDVQRQMTALYMDVTDLAEMLYESQETDRVQRAVDRMWHAFQGIAEEQGGVLESRTGEAGLLLWGRAEAQESDPEQAIRAALRMKEAIGQAVLDQLGETPEELPFKAGVTTGPVLVTREAAGDSTASGTTITLASRLKESAPPGEILLSHDTYTHVRGVFDVRELPPVRMRGRSEPIQVYVALRPRPRAFRLQARGIEGIETKMIGREPELKVLQDALMLTIEDSETQVVTVVGDAGVGKSRLLYEFSNWVDLLEERLWFFQARATQPSMLQPYSLTRDLFSFRFQILDNDPLPAVHAKFVQGVGEFMDGRSREVAPLIGQLVGFDFSDDPLVKPALRDPESFHQQALGHLGEFFLSAAKSNPVFIQVEDIHWADDRSLDLLNSLARENTAIPLFVIYMARPGLYDRRPSWGEGQRFHARINLEPLSRLDSRRLVRELLKKVEEVPAELRDLIIDRAEGNPFYTEELVKMLIDDGVILKGPERWQIDLSRLDPDRVPPTLVGVLQSRLDSFPPSQRALLQRASVQGRIFWESGLAHLSAAEGVPAGAVASMLNDLRRREMVFKREESAFEGTAEYGFRHAVLRDVVYDTIVPRQRRTYHRQVAEWLVEAGSARLSEYRTLIAEHLEHGEAYAEAADFLRSAASRARDLGGHPEAVGLLEKSLRLPLDGAARLPLQLELGINFALMGRYEEAKAQLEPALQSARELGDRAAEASALAELGRIVGVWQGDEAAGRRYFDQVLTIARELGDQPRVMFVLRQLGNLANGRGELSEAARLLEESIAIARQLGDSRSVAQGLNSLGNTYQLREDLQGALNAYSEALVLSQEVGDRGMVSMTTLNTGDVYYDQGNYEAALREVRTALQLAEESGSDYLAAGSHFILASAQVGLGEFASAKRHLAQAIRLAQIQGAVGGVVITVAEYGRLKAREGDRAGGLELLGLATRHPALDAFGKRRASAVLEEIGRGLPEAEVEAALERGSRQDLDQVVQGLLTAA